jgi:hypothetical protein
LLACDTKNGAIQSHETGKETATAQLFTPNIEKAQLLAVQG